MSDVAYTANARISLPDVEITENRGDYVYVPLRGYSAILAVFNIDDRPIGWIDTRTLGYENAKAWIAATGWRDQGY